MVEGGSELGAPAMNGLTADLDAAFRQEVLDIAKAEMEAVVEPDGVGDDLTWEAAAPIQRRYFDGHLPIVRAPIVNVTTPFQVPTPYGI
jgi:hypothetical protein